LLKSEEAAQDIPMLFRKRRNSPLLIQPQCLETLSQSIQSQSLHTTMQIFLIFCSPTK